MAPGILLIFELRKTSCAHKLTETVECIKYNW